MPTHRVANGECLSSIASRYGFFWQTLWELPENAGLRADGRAPNLLLAGDQVVIPDRQAATRPCATDGTHRFRVRGVPVMLRLRLVHDGEPRTGDLYELEIDGHSSRGVVGADGMVVVAIDPQARRGVLRVGEEEGEDFVEHELRLGHLDPIGTLSGVKARLANLGFGDAADVPSGSSGHDDDDLDEPTREAICGFQASVGLDPTGELDDTTRARLARAHDG